MPELAAPTTEGDSMTPFLLRLGAAGVAVLLAGAAQAQSCTTIGSSTFCGARGSHNTVGNTMIFNQGPAGQRVGGYAIIGTPPRTQVIRDRKSVVRGQSVEERVAIGGCRTLKKKKNKQ